MGGRSREVKNRHSDKWNWLSSLSDSRLENYGIMSQDIYRSTRDIGKEALNYHAAKEFENRFGYQPSWGPNNPMNKAAFNKNNGINDLVNALVRARNHEK